MIRRILGITLCSISLLAAQDRITPTSSFVVNFDFARFRNDDSTKFLELYFACFPHLVTLERFGDQYRGSVEIQLELENKESGALVERSRSLIPISVSDTSGAAYRNTLVGQMGYVVPVGEYHLRITAIDTLAPSRRDTFSVEIPISEPLATLYSSDLELCTNIRQSTNTGDPFYKNAHEVVPNPTLLFGTANYPVVFHYLELYNLKSEETYTVKTILADGAGKPLQENSRKRKYGFGNSVELGTTNATKLASGKYLFQVLLLSSSSEPLLKIEKPFFVYNPQMMQPAVSNAGMRETSLSGLSAEELAQEFDQARYLASQQEINTFAQISSAEGRREFLGKFWDEAEAGKMGYIPIKREDYLMRIRRANERYRALSREGWKTDRGRVLSLYGEPEEVDRRPSSEGGKPHEIWSYYQIENGVVFVFVDRTGFGDYVLVHSTKRGELRDDDWQRLLQ